MECIKVKQMPISEELQKHFSHLCQFLDYDEIESIYKVIEYIIENYAYKEREYAHINRGKNHNFGTLLEKEGDENHVELSDEEIQRINDEAPLTLTVIHNHPNSSAPGRDDFFVLITHGSVRNMVVFGITGNLYIVQKTNSNLYINHSDTKAKDDLKERLEKAWKLTGTVYAQDKYPNLTPKERVERIRRSTPEEQKEFFTAVSNKYFIRICEDDEYEFNYYPKRLNKNGR
jgi:hypothetical protein